MATILILSMGRDSKFIHLFDILIHGNTVRMSLALLMIYLDYSIEWGLWARNNYYTA